MKNNFLIISILCFILGFLSCQKEQNTKEKSIVKSTEMRSTTLCPGGENNPPVVTMTGHSGGNPCCVLLRFTSSYNYHDAKIKTFGNGSGPISFQTQFNTEAGYVEVCFQHEGNDFSVEILDSNGNVIACNIFENPCD